MGDFVSISLLTGCTVEYVSKHNARCTGCLFKCMFTCQHGCECTSSSHVSLRRFVTSRMSSWGVRSLCGTPPERRSWYTSTDTTRSLFSVWQCCRGRLFNRPRPDRSEFYLVAHLGNAKRSAAWPCACVLAQQHPQHHAGPSRFHSSGPEVWSPEPMSP